VLSPAACVALLRCTWPGNVRQLKSSVEAAALTTTHEVLEPTDLRLDDATGSFGPNLQLPIAQAKVEFERVYYQALLKHVGNGRKWALRGAKIAGLDRTGFIKALRRLGLYPDQYPESLEE
jgi:transcriptional regulator of acetoin/glycerol metabolism